MNMRKVFGNLAIGPLEEVAPPPLYLRDLLERSALHLLSSELIIEDNHRPFDLPTREIPSSKIVDDRARRLIDPIVASIGEDGFAPHFHRLIRAFAAANFDGDTDQVQGTSLSEWIAAPQPYCFLMTDKGGPNIANWRSYCFNEEGREYLKVDKVWAINGANFGMAAVAARSNQSAFPVPVTFFLPPAQCQQLKKVPAGRPFLDGTVQLGNVSGIVEISAANHVNGGYASDAERALDTARVNFIRALMQHVMWLATRERATLDERRVTAIRYIYDVATEISSEKSYTNLTTLRVKALKFACNQLLAELVAEERVIMMSDQRDLLGFSKMEGSSYFCLMRLYGHFHRRNRVDSLKSSQRSEIGNAA